LSSICCGAVITVGADISSQGCIEANAHAMARYAALCQEAGFVPVVELEMLMDERMHPDLLLACTDNQSSKHAINEAAVRLGIPVVGVWVYEGGIAGGICCTRADAPVAGALRRSSPDERESWRSLPA